MAIIEQGVLGGFRGKCGGVIGYFRNGVACVRAMPAHYRDRRSAAQLRNRGRFTMVMKMMSVVRPAITLGFRRFASAMTEMNVATRVNYYRLVKDGAAGMEYDYAGMVLSRGGVEGLSGLMMRASGTDLDVVWDGRGVLGGAEDEVSVVLLNGGRMKMKFYRGVALRGDGGLRVSVPTGWSSEEVHCYVMVERGEEWSDSAYLGEIWANGAAVRADFDGVGADFEFEEGGDGLCFCSDQSVIRVLPDSGLEGGGNMLDEGDDGGG